MTKRSRFYGLLVLGFCWLVTHALIQAQIPLTGVLSLEDRQHLSRSFAVIDEHKSHIWPNWVDTPKDIVIQNEKYRMEIKSSPISDASNRYWAFQFNRIHISQKKRTITPVHTLALEGKNPQIIVSREFFEQAPRAFWLGTLAHEHFHQWQMSRSNYFDAVTKLSINNNYSNCGWMIDYPFPFHQDAVGKILIELSSLHRLKDVEPKQKMDIIHRSLNQLKTILSKEEWDYVAFQIWQEGIARYVEYTFLNELLQKEQRRNPQDGSMTAQLQTYISHLFEPATSIAFPMNREIFYRIGLGIGLVLEQQKEGSNWKEIYANHPISLAFLGINPTFSALE